MAQKTTQITLTYKEVDAVVKGLSALRDRCYHRYYHAKDRQSETAQNNLKRYEELDALRIRIGQDYFGQGLETIQAVS